MLQTNIPSGTAIQEIISRTPLFKAIRSRADLIHLATVAQLKRFSAGDIIYTPGPVHEIAIILAGRVAVRLGEDIEPHCLNAGSMMG